MDYDTSEAASVLDQLDELIHGAKPIPLTTQVRIDRIEIYNLLDRLRIALHLAPSSEPSPGTDESA